MYDLVAFDIFSQNILIATLLISILRHQLRLIPGQQKNTKIVSPNYSGYIHKNVKLMSLEGFFSVPFLLFSMMCIFDRNPFVKCDFNRLNLFQVCQNNKYVHINHCIRAT